MAYLPSFDPDPFEPHRWLRTPHPRRSGAPVAGYQAIPGELVAALGELPFDVHVRRDDRMVLYAARGADPFAISIHAREGLEMYVEAGDLDALRSASTRALARALGHRQSLAPVGSDATGDRLGRVISLAAALIGPCYVPNGPVDAQALASALDAVDLLTHALVADTALRDQLLAVHPLHPYPSRPASRVDPASGLRGERGFRSRDRRLRDPSAVSAGLPADPSLPVRGIVVLALSVALAAEIGAPFGSGLLDLGRGAALLDVGVAHLTIDLPGRSGHAALDRYRRRRHVVIGPEVIERVLGDRPPFVRFLAGHHERLDGSGYPGALAGRDLEPAVALVGLADAAVALLAPRTGGSISRTAALRIAPYAFRGRFAEEHIVALVAVLHGTGSGADRQPIVLA